ncbi:MAG: hypothetical protein WD046_10095 [Paracoccaceae bacterium]
MNKVVILGGVVVIAVAGYFGGQAAGLFGGATGMSDADISAALNARAAAANAEDGQRYDDWSRLTAATVDGKTITYTGVSLLNADQIDENYLGSRTGQLGNKICNDAESRALSQAGTTTVQVWETADGEPIGTVTAGPAFCAEQGY